MASQKDVSRTHRGTEDFLLEHGNALAQRIRFDARVGNRLLADCAGARIALRKPLLHARKTPLFVLSCPCVCPEPVLLKRSIVGSCLIE
jgi:hypothetical protein